MKRSVLLIVCSVLVSLVAYAQKNVYLTISHKLGNTSFAYNTTAQNDLLQNFQVTRLAYYLSSIKIIHDGGQEIAVPSKHILANATNSTLELLGNFNVTNVEGVKFSVGVEAPTNNADPTQYPAWHPLAPQSPTMHWGWASGYNFIVLEGATGSSFGTIFQMHALGNDNYVEQTQMAAGVVEGNNIFINLDADYVQALKGVNISTGPVHHGDNATDLQVLLNFMNHVFKPGAGLPTKLNSAYQSEQVSFFPNPTNSLLHFTIGHTNQIASSAVVKDVTGKVLANYSSLYNNTIDLSRFSAGMYLVSLHDDNGRVMTAQRITVQ
jgi:hypothetical protein